MTAVSTRVADALGPVRAAIVSRARADASALVSDARAEAAATLAAAERQASAIRQEARARGEADAVDLLGAERVRAQRQARGIVLSAQLEVQEELRGRVRAAVGALREDTDYPDLREALVRRARVLLGPDAAVTEHPSGGIVANASGRRAVLSLEVLADHVVDLLGVQLDGLWAP